MTDPISIFVFMLKELQMFIIYLHVFAALINVSETYSLIKTKCRQCK